jgi:hypothetical protein
MYRRMHSTCTIKLNLETFVCEEHHLYEVKIIWTGAFSQSETRLSEEKFEDTVGIIRNRKSKKDRQSMDKRNKPQRTNNDLQNITQKTKERQTRPPTPTKS